MSVDRTRIWVLDDEDQLREVMAENVRTNGELVESFKDKDEVLKRLKTECPDVLVVDLKLSKQQDEEGFEVLRAARRASKDIKVLIVTVHHTLERGVQAFEEGAFDYIARNETTDYLRCLRLKTQLAVRLRERDLRRRLQCPDVQRRAWDAFCQELEGLLQSDRGKWVAFHDDKRVATAESKQDVYAELEAANLPLKEVLVRRVEPLGRPVDLRLYRGARLG